MNEADPILFRHIDYEGGSYIGTGTSDVNRKWAPPRPGRAESGSALREGWEDDTSRKKANWARFESLCPSIEPPPPLT